MREIPTEKQNLGYYFLFIWVYNPHRTHMKITGFTLPRDATGRQQASTTFKYYTVHTLSMTGEMTLDQVNNIMEQLESYTKSFKPRHGMNMTRNEFQYCKGEYAYWGKVRDGLVHLINQERLKVEVENKDVVL
jgi:hypothetical protein